MSYFFIHFLLLCCLLNVSNNAEIEFDPNGYLIFCLCMGRFGNQAEHFLGINYNSLIIQLFIIKHIYNNRSYVIC